MNALAGSSPAITATRDGRFPDRAGFGRAWEEILQTSSTWRDLDCGQYLSAWCGYAPDHVVEKFAGVNHVGIYMGGNRFIHSPHPGDVVKISSMTGWYADTFVGATRPY